MKDKIPLPLSYEDAKSLVLFHYKNVNTAFDYGDAFVFVNKADSDTISDRGYAILKKNGKLMTLGEYLYMRDTNASPKSIPFQNEDL